MTSKNETVQKIATETIINILEYDINTRKINTFTYFMEEMFTDEETSEILYNHIPYTVGYAYTNEGDKQEFKKWETESLENSNSLINMGEKNDTKSLFMTIDLEQMEIKYSTYNKDDTLKIWKSYYGVYNKNSETVEENNDYDEYDYYVITPEEDKMREIMKQEEQSLKTISLPLPTDKYLQELDNILSYPEIVTDYIISNKNKDNKWIKYFIENSDTFKKKETVLKDKNNFSVKEDDESYKTLIRLSQELYRKTKNIKSLDNCEEEQYIADNNYDYNYNYIDDEDPELQLDNSTIAFEFDADNSGGGANLYIINNDNEIIEQKDIELYDENWEQTKEFELYLELRENMNEAWEGIITVIDMDTMELAIKFYTSEDISYLHNIDNVKNTIKELINEIE